MCGLVPFGETLDDPFEIYSEIVTNSNIEFPNYMKDKVAQRFIK